MSAEQPNALQREKVCTPCPFQCAAGTAGEMERRQQSPAEAGMTVLFLRRARLDDSLRGGGICYK